MKNYRDSDYAVNKYASGIVYRFADKAVEITLEDYLREYPGATEADFAELKALSDEIYLEQSRDDYRQTHLNVSLDGLDETTACGVPSPETAVIDEPERAAAEYRRQELASRALDVFTETQRRRYQLHAVEGRSTWDIARMEGVNQSKIMKSLDGAEKKIKKVLTEG